MFHKALAALLVFSLIVPPNLYAQSSGQAGLPVPGTMLSLSKPYMPVMVKGLLVHPEYPFKFDFIIDSGDTGFKGAALKAESMKLIKYFLAALTVPEEEMWVNLSPYEKDRMIPKTFGDTDMGRDLLAQDYILKQLTASLTYPEKEMGKTFWDKVYEQAQAKFGTTNIPVNTFNKVWIVPQKAGVYEHANGAFVIESKLKVMTEQDYLAMSKHVDIQDPNINALGAQIIREIIIPALEKEVNEGAHFANLRQIYQAMILATWYKIRLKDSILGKLYVDQHKTKGVAWRNKDMYSLRVPISPEVIYQQYLRAFKKGVYNYIKEDLDPATRNITPRKYVSGGFTVEAGVTGAGNNFSLMVGHGTTSNPTFAMLSKVEEFEGNSAQVTWEANRIASKNLADAAMARTRDTIDQKFLNYWQRPDIQKDILETMDPGIMRDLRTFLNQMLTPLREAVKKDGQNTNTEHQIKIREKALELLDKKELDELEKRIAPILVQSYKPGSSTVDSLINALKQIGLGDNVLMGEMIIKRKDVSTFFNELLDNQDKSPVQVQDIDGLRKTLTKNTAWKVLRFTIGSSSIDVVVGLPHLYLVRIQPPNPAMIGRHSGSIGGQTSVTAEDINELFRAASEEKSVDAVLQLYKIISTGILGSVRVNKDMRDDVWLKWQNKPELLRRLLYSSPTSSAMTATAEDIKAEFGPRIRGRNRFIVEDLKRAFEYLDNKKEQDEVIRWVKEVNPPLIQEILAALNSNAAMKASFDQIKNRFEYYKKNLDQVGDKEIRLLGEWHEDINDLIESGHTPSGATTLMDEIDEFLRLRPWERVVRRAVSASLGDSGEVMIKPVGQANAMMETGRNHHIYRGNQKTRMSGEERQKRVREMNEKDKAMTPGGIDLNTKKGLDFEIKRDDKGMPLPVQLQNLQELDFETLYPEILSIVGVLNFSELLGLDQKPLQKQAAV